MARRKFKSVKFTSFLELSNDPNELLQLLSQAESLNVQAEDEMKLRRAERELIKRKLRQVRKNLSEMQVSDHAIVRYLERVTGIDIAACKREILSKVPPEMQPPVQADPVEFVKLKDNDLYFVIRDNLIISVTPKPESEE